MAEWRSVVEKCGECGKGWDEGCGGFKEVTSRKGGNNGGKKWKERAEEKSRVGGGRFFPCWGQCCCRGAVVGNWDRFGPEHMLFVLRCRRA